MLRHILHDWSDPYASKILKQLRAAAKESTRLVFVEQLLLYACYDPSTGTSSVVGAAELGGPLPPAPLLPNMGIVNLTSYLTDMQVSWREEWGADVERTQLDGRTDADYSTLLRCSQDSTAERGRWRNLRFYSRPLGGRSKSCSSHRGRGSISLRDQSSDRRLLNEGETSSPSHCNLLSRYF